MYKANKGIIVRLLESLFIFQSSSRLVMFDHEPTEKPVN